MPSVSMVMNVSHSPCQEGNSKSSPTIRPNELQTIGYQICPDVGERCCGAGENLAECLGVLQYPVEDDDGLIPLFWRLRPDSLGRLLVGSFPAIVLAGDGECSCHLGIGCGLRDDKKGLLSDPIFQQKDLFAPATLDAARHAARDVSLYKGAQSRPSTSSGATQRRPFSSSSASRGRTQSSSAPATPQHSQASSSSKPFTPQKKSPDPPRGFSGVGVCPLAQLRRLSGPLLTSLEGSGSRCLGRGVLARVPSSTPQASHGTGSSGSRLLQSPICGPEGFRGVAPHHRPIHPGHLRRVPAISHGDSSVRPSLHSPKQLDDLIRSLGRIPPGSGPSGIVSVSSLHHRRSLLSV